MLGVCLGLQAIGHVYGGSIVRAPSLMHGKTSPIEHRGVGIFHDLPSPLTATRYHSLVIDPATMPECLEVTATSGDVVMGIRHRTLPIEGVQFHPESILTGVGHDLLRNFLNAARSRSNAEPAALNVPRRTSTASGCRCRSPCCCRSRVRDPVGH